MPPAQRLGQIQTGQPLGLNRIILVYTKTPVKRGEYCTVTIQGKPGVAYSIAATYKLGDKTLTTQESKMADSNGGVTWNWLVGADTVPGTYPITITGGGMDFDTAYSVTE